MLVIAGTGFTKSFIVARTDNWISCEHFPGLAKEDSYKSFEECVVVIDIFIGE